MLKCQCRDQQRLGLVLHTPDSLAKKKYIYVCIIYIYVVFYCFVDFVVFSYFVLRLWQTANRMMKHMWRTDRCSLGVLKCFEAKHPRAAFMFSGGFIIFAPLLQCRCSKGKKTAWETDWSWLTILGDVRCIESFPAKRLSNILKPMRTYVVYDGVGLRCLHSTCRFLVRKVSQITTANRPMCCRKPSRLKGNWDMFSIAISSYIF